MTRYAGWIVAWLLAWSAAGCVHGGRASAGLDGVWTAALVADPERLHLHAEPTSEPFEGLLPWTYGPGFSPCEIEVTREDVLQARHELRYDGSARLLEQLTDRRTVTERAVWEHYGYDEGDQMGNAEVSWMESTVVEVDGRPDSHVEVERLEDGLPIARWVGPMLAAENQRTDSRAHFAFRWKKRRVTVFWVGAAELAMDYDARGRLVAMVPAGFPPERSPMIVFSYDSRNRLSQRSWIYTETELVRIDQTFDWAQGRIETTTLARSGETHVDRILLIYEERRPIRVGYTTVEWDDDGRPMEVRYGRDRTRYRYGCSRTEMLRSAPDR